MYNKKRYCNIRLNRLRPVKGILQYSAAQLRFWLNIVWYGMLDFIKKKIPTSRNFQLWCLILNQETKVLQIHEH